MKRRLTSVSLVVVMILTLAGGGVAGVTGAAAQDATPAAGATPADAVEIPLIDVSESDVGMATFSESNGTVTVSVTVEGLEPGERGIHIHEMGICDPTGEEPFSSAGSHYNPNAGTHGAPDDPMSHAGDLGNITIGEDGSGSFEIVTDRFTLSEGPESLFDTDGSALLIHEMTDDLETDPTGLSGARVACGVVAEPTDEAGAARQAEMSGALFVPEQVTFSEDLLAELQAPEGFEISVFASGLTNPRMMVVVSEGTVLVTQRSANNVLALRDTDGDGAVDESEVVASNLPYVHGLAIRENQLYMAGEKTIWVADLESDGTLGEPAVLVDDLPEGGQHPNNTIAIGPDDMLYISIGSTCNACPETNPENATLLRMNPDGSERIIYASGLRNTLGWGWHPETGELWGMDMGSDWRGDEQPPDELNHIEHGNNYGWPFCFADRQVDEYTSQLPTGSTPEQYCEQTEGAALTYEAHSSPLDLVYYTADQFPEEYQGDAFVTMRGSWNREQPVGYKVVHLTFEDGQPVEFNDFITGWLLDDGEAQFGRVAGLVLLPDGSMLIAEDTNGVIYRVAYTG